jgi:hypothetical protein
MARAMKAPGYATRDEVCPKHGITFPQMFFPAVPGQAGFWSGQCEKCAEDIRLDRQADYILSKVPHAELIRIADEEPQPTDQQIEQETDTRIESLAQRYLDDLEECRPGIAGEIRAFHRQQAWDRARERKKAQIIESLRGA